MAYNPYGYGMTPDMDRVIGGGTQDEEDNSGPLNPRQRLNQMSGGSNIAPLLMMMQAQQQQAQNPFLQSLIGGAALATGQQIPQPQPMIKPLDMIKLVMSQDMENRRLVMDQWKLEKEQEGLLRQYRIDQQNAETKRLEQENKKIDMAFNQGKEFFTLANQTAALSKERPDDPILAKNYVDLMRAGFSKVKEAGGPTVEFPENYVLSRANKTLTTEQEQQMWKYATVRDPITGQPQVSREAAARLLPEIDPRILDEAYRVGTNPKVAEIMGGTKMAQEAASLEATNLSNIIKRNGLEEPNTYREVTSALASMGIKDILGATQNQIESAKTIARVTLLKQDIEKKTAENNADIAKQRTLKKLEMGDPLSQDEVRKIMEPFNQTKMQMGSLQQMKEWLNQVPKDAFPSSDDVASATWVKLNNWAKYKSNTPITTLLQTWQEFSAGVVARGIMDDKFRAVGPIKRAIEMGNDGLLPRRETFDELIKFYEKLIPDAATSAYKDLSYGKASLAVPDIRQRALEEAGPWIDAKEVSKSLKPAVQELSPLGPQPMKMRISPDRYRMLKAQGRSDAEIRAVYEVD